MIVRTVRPRRARLRPPAAEQGHDDLRRAEPRAVHGRLPEALPARRALAGARRGGRPRADAARDRRRGRPGRALAVAARREPRRRALEDPDAPRAARLDPLPDRRVPDHQRRHRRADRTATSARSSTAATSSPATSRSRTSTSPAQELRDEPGVRALRHLERPVRDPQPRQRPRLRSARQGAARLAATSARTAKYGPVELPAYGPRAPITALPEPPSTGVATNGHRRTRGSASQPGTYLIVPADAADAGALPLRGRPAERARRRPATPSRRRHRPLLLRADAVTARARPDRRRCLGCSPRRAAAAPAAGDPDPEPARGAAAALHGRAGDRATRCAGPWQPRPTPRSPPTGAAAAGSPPATAPPRRSPGRSGHGTTRVERAQLGTCASLAFDARGPPARASATARSGRRCA